MAVGLNLPSYVTAVVPDFDRRAEELSDRFVQQLTQFNARPSRYGYEQLQRTFQELAGAIGQAQESLSRARAVYFQRLSEAGRRAVQAERRVRY